MYQPDHWIVAKLPTCYKLLTTQRGGYLYGDSWRINSGIESCTKDGDYFFFKGYSGSCYLCHEFNYGMSSYGYIVYEELLQQKGVEIIPFQDFEHFNFNIEGANND